jgi:hypothetical protein
MAAEIFNEQAGQASRAGTTSRDTSTATAMPAGDDQWIKFTFGTPYTPAIGEILWICVFNTAASPGTDYPNILTATTVNNQQSATATFGFSTANGFTSNGSSLTKIPFLLKCGSNYIGFPFTQQNSGYYTSNTRERGIQITPDEDLTISAWVANVGGTTFSDLRFLADATAPGGSAIHTFDLDSDAGLTTADLLGVRTFSPVTLTGGTTYKITTTLTANTQAPNVYQIEDYSSYSSVFDAWRAHNQYAYPWSVIDDGAGGWTIDKSVSPQGAYMIDEHPAIASSGGGGAIVIGG